MEKNSIALTPCQSSNVKACGYDPTTRTLAVQFAGGGIYHYQDVPPEVYDGFQKAESKGSFIAKSVRSVFKGVRV